MVTELIDWYKTAEDRSEIKGVILTGRPDCFSAGLNLMKVAMGGIKGLKDFLMSYNLLAKTMTRFSKPFIAAITGYAPAGACVLACTADYRIMARGEKHTIGMNEMLASIQIPNYMMQLVCHWLNNSKAIELILDGKLINADEAVKVGWVNEAAEVAEVLPKAEAKMQQWVKAYPAVLNRTKKFLKADLLNKIDYDAEAEIDEMLQDYQDAEYLQQVMAFASKL